MIFSSVFCVLGGDATIRSGVTGTIGKVSCSNHIDDFSSFLPENVYNLIIPPSVREA